MNMGGYKLRAVLQGHGADVRQVATAFQGEGALISASRDKTAKLWFPHDDNTYSVRKTYKGHSKFVSCILSLDSSEEFPAGLIVTGSQDGKIRGYLPDVEDPLFLMEGHTENVTSLYASKFGTIISGSWDKTARVWLNRKCTMTLTGHDMAVWCVGILPEVGVMLTGSADKTIRLWRTGKCELVLKGHTDAVRGLAVISSSLFLSCCNDATVRQWNTSGECLGVYYGHENYIYSIALLPNGKDWVTSGEDRSMRVWEDGKVIQTIYLPAISCWSVAVLANGDIAVATSDGQIRLFSKEPSRQASGELQAMFEEELSRCSLAAQQELGGVKVSDLPGPEALYEPGRKDGQTKMVREGEKVSVHSWSMAEQKWTKIGDVVGAAGGSEATSGKKLYQGKEYDYVFDIEIDEPRCTLKLPFNVADDPYMAAQQFIHKHDLSQYYLDEIASHIIKNTGGQTLGLGAGGNADPLTGGSSYTTAGLSTASATAGTAADPFTGSGAYTTGSGSGDLPTLGSAPPPDPWMAGAYRTDGDGMEVDESNPYFPVTEFILFNAPLKAEPLITKLKEFNSQVPVELQLEEGAIDELPSLALAEGESLHLVPHLVKVLSWPEGCLFPGLDLLRLVVLHPHNKKFFLTKPLIDDVFSVCLRFVNKDASVPNQMLSLRILTNMFSSSEGEEFLRLYRESVVSRVCEQLFPITGDNKNIQVSAASLLLNYAVSVYKTMDEETQIQVLSVLSINFLTFITDWEARFRTLAALGTLLHDSKDAVTYAKTLETLDGVRSWKLLEGPPKVSTCAEFIVKLL